MCIWCWYVSCPPPLPFFWDSVVNGRFVSALFLAQKHMFLSSHGISFHPSLPPFLLHPQPVPAALVGVLFLVKDLSGLYQGGGGEANAGREGGQKEGRDGALLVGMCLFLYGERGDV